MRTYSKLSKNFSTSTASKFLIPSAPIQPGLLGKVGGNLKEIYELSKRNKQNIGMGLYLKSTDWYNLTNSKTIKIRMLNSNFILSSDPNFYREVLGSKQDSFTNSLDFKIIFGHFFKTSMIVVEGDQWMRIRKIAQKAINNKSLDDLVPIVCDTTEKFFLNSKVNKAETIDMMMRVTFDSFHRLMYGWDPRSVLFSIETNELLLNCNIIAESIGKRSFLPIKSLWSLPTKENKRVDNAAFKIKRFVEDFVINQKKFIKKNLNNQNYVKSLLDELIIAAENGEEGLTNEELYDQICTLFFGAYDTTSNTLNFFFNYLARHPEIQIKLREEIFKRFPEGFSDIKKAKIADIESVQYLNHFIDEVHRLHAIVPFFPRDCIKDVTINNFEIKKGTRILIDTKSVGKDPSYWNGQDDLENFKPERWQLHKPPIIKRVMPFGFGGRICIGRKIALAEMKVLLVAIISKYEVTLRNPNETLEMDIVIGLNIKAGNGNINFNRI